MKMCHGYHRNLYLRALIQLTVLLLVISLDMNEWLGGSELEDTGSCDIRDTFSSAFLLLLEGCRRLSVSFGLGCTFSKSLSFLSSSFFLSSYLTNRLRSVTKV